MSAHLNIESNIATVYGVNLHADAEADDCSKTESVEILELPAAASNEIIAADPANTKTVETSVSGDGPISLTLTPAVVATPSDLVMIDVEVSEAPNQRCTFSATASASMAFTDPNTTVGAVGAEPGIGDLEITCVEYAIAESTRRSSSVTDMVLTGTDGTPAARATTQKQRTFSISGRGDVPVGVALGTGGAAFVGGNAGKVLANRVMTGEKRGDWNRWSTEGNHYLEAA